MGFGSKVLLGALKLVVAVAALGAGYIFGAWGYLGLFLGEPNHGRELQYLLMFLGGLSLALISVLLFISLIRSIWSRRS